VEHLKKIHREIQLSNHYLQTQAFFPFEWWIARNMANSKAGTALITAPPKNLHPDRAWACGIHAIGQARRGSTHREILSSLLRNTLIPSPSCRGGGPTCVHGRRLTLSPAPKSSMQIAHDAPFSDARILKTASHHRHRVRPHPPTNKEKAISQASRPRASSSATWRSHARPLVTT
jgi:hypothetical protein